MPKQIPEDELRAIEATLRGFEEGGSIDDILQNLPLSIPRRTLQYRLAHLVKLNRVTARGKGRWTRYLIKGQAGEIALTADESRFEDHPAFFVPLSSKAAEIQRRVSLPIQRRNPAGYDRTFLDTYRPNITMYLSRKERDHLHEIGRGSGTDDVAGTYARQILNRLLIDLSWNSSRLEGNTYSLLDTERLIAEGEPAEGKSAKETQMILNHRDAIQFLVESADEIGFNRHTILNLHALLSNNLLDDPLASGRLRTAPVGISHSVFHPLEVPQLIEECFDRILQSAAAIEDPFEQAFFVLVQMPYLQPFYDVNKRVSRLAANIPLIRHNLCPLSFIDLPDATYTQGVLGVYELKAVELLRDVFIWSYGRSAGRYASIRQSLGEPDPFRFKYRAAIRQIVADIIKAMVSKKDASRHILKWTRENIPPGDQSRFIEVVETELLALHEGNFARYQIRPSQFEAWQSIWKTRPR